MVISLVHFPGCPHVAAARDMIREAVRDLDPPPCVVEVDVTATDTPAALRDWGSPTIMVNGVDIAGGAPSGTSCRLYQGSSTPGVPPLALLQAALGRAKTLP